MLKPGLRQLSFGEPSSSETWFSDVDFQCRTTAASKHRVANGDTETPRGNLATGTGASYTWRPYSGKSIRPHRTERAPA